MNETFDVIVIGGGIMDCSSAYQLTKRGMKVAVVKIYND
ncbi:MAG TPA: FAD-binding oxidoreductase [Candidatus Marinimicrobia bacterium]|nr:FAD-binding oxidoreductase [Candidatus Neomarinimicrobiota bacterium]